MRIAFHAPLKPPDHPVPSGDRRMARALFELLGRLGHGVELACPFRTYDRDGDSLRQTRLRELGGRLAHRLAKRLRADCWLTYHCYHKAPDWLGPVVTRALDMPYLIAEPSFAGKQTGGRWAVGHEGARRAFAAADVLLAMTEDDAEGLAGLVAPPAEVRLFPPFLNAAPYGAAAHERARHRAHLAASEGLDPALPWLLAVAMMRADVKRESYFALVDALGLRLDLAWQLVVIGDGEAREEIEARLRGLGEERVRCLGAMPEEALPPWYAASDILLWPAFREAYGLALLEAQAAGLPVVACREGGVSAVVEDGRTGILVADRSIPGLAAAVRTLLHDESLRQGLGRAAMRRVAALHDMAPAGRRLADALAAAAAIHARRRELACAS
jgi:hypothetical protein